MERWLLRLKSIMGVLLVASVAGYWPVLVAKGGPSSPPAQQMAVPTTEPNPTGESKCHSRFPYGRKAFLNKFLQVANTYGSPKMLRKMEQVFGVAMPESLNHDGVSVEECEWYTRLGVARYR
jgi:hypothetical protein